MLEHRLPLQTVFLMAATMVSASTIPYNNLFEQPAAVCVSGMYHCDAAPDIPENMCCKATTRCRVFAGNTTINCCPSNADCTIITPISCDLSLQDPSLHPGAVFQTTALRGSLGHCGAGTCCPFGYSCITGTDGPYCKMNVDQNPRPVETLPPESTSTSTRLGEPSFSASSIGIRTSSSLQTVPTTSPLSSPTSSPTGSGGAGAITTTSPNTEPTPTPEESSPPSKTPTAVIAGAAVGAILLLSAGIFIAWILLKRRSSRASTQHRRRGSRDGDSIRRTRSTSSFGNFISKPIVSEMSTMRTDFVRKSPGRTSVTSIGSQDTTLAPTTPRYNPNNNNQTAPKIPPIRGMNNQAAARQSSIAYGYGAPETSPYAPRTPPRQRAQSGISINVFADPRTVGNTPAEERRDIRGSHQTTFSDMLRSADLGGVARGEPFVPGTPRTPRTVRSGGGTPGRVIGESRLR